MSRLPTIGGDNNTWGDVLNDFLRKEHNPDGSQKTLPVSKGGTGATNAATARSNIGAASSADLALKADNTSVVHKAGTETISGDKDFTGAVSKNGASLITKIQDAADVSLTGAADGDPLIYDASSGGAKQGNGGSLSSVRGRAGSLLDALSPVSARDPFSQLSSDAPTISFGTSRTIATYKPVRPHTGDVRVTGWYEPWNPATTLLPGDTCAGLDFYLYGTEVEIAVQVGFSGALPIIIFVDGLPVTADTDVTTINPVTGNTIYYIKLSWLAAKTRHIEIFTSRLGNWSLVFFDPTAGIAPGPARRKIAWLGDSFFSGATTSGANALQVTPFLASRRMGVECVNPSYGGTGYTNAGSYVIYGAASRMAQLVAAQPDLVVVLGSVNDDAASAATITAAAAACFAAIKAALPNVPIIVFGPQPTNATDTIGATRQANIAAVKAAAIAADNVIGFHDMVGTAAAVPAAWSSKQYNEGDLVTRLGSVWKYMNSGTASTPAAPGSAGSTAGLWKLVTYILEGTGKVGSTTGDGSRDVLLYSDGTHPTADGHRALAALVEQQIRADLVNCAEGGVMVVN